MSFLETVVRVDEKTPIPPASAGDPSEVVLLDDVSLCTSQRDPTANDLVARDQVLVRSTEVDAIRRPVSLDQIAVRLVQPHAPDVAGQHRDIRDRRLDNLEELDSGLELLNGAVLDRDVVEPAVGVDPGVNRRSPLTEAVDGVPVQVQHDGVGTDNDAGEGAVDQVTVQRRVRGDHVAALDVRRPRGGTKEEHREKRHQGREEPDPAQDKSSPRLLRPGRVYARGQHPDKALVNGSHWARMGTGAGSEAPALRTPRPFPALQSATRARSSAGERSLHTREVAGSIPAAPMSTNRLDSVVSSLRALFAHALVAYPDRQA